MQYSREYIEQLTNSYVASYIAMGMPAKQANEMANDTINRAIEEVYAGKHDEEPENYGDVLLSWKSSKPGVKSYVDQLYAEGVRDEDIRWWYNMPAIERLLIKQADDLNVQSAYIEFRKQGLDGAAAAQRTLAIHPKLGGVEPGNDPTRQLPYELKKRIIEYLERRQLNPASFALDIEKFGNLNALIRFEIGKGEL